VGKPALWASLHCGQVAACTCTQRDVKDAQENPGTMFVPQELRCSAVTAVRARSTSGQVKERIRVRKQYAASLSFIIRIMVWH
jgi:hypothetical protein